MVLHSRKSIFNYELDSEESDASPSKGTKRRRSPSPVPSTNPSSASESPIANSSKGRLKSVLKSEPRFALLSTATGVPATQPDRSQPREDLADEFIVAHTTHEMEEEEEQRRALEEKRKKARQKAEQMVNKLLARKKAPGKPMVNRELEWLKENNEKWAERYTEKRFFKDCNMGRGG